MIYTSILDQFQVFSIIYLKMKKENRLRDQSAFIKIITYSEKQLYCLMCFKYHLVIWQVFKSEIIKSQTICDLIILSFMLKLL